MQSCYKFPKVDATRTPRDDHIMKTLAPQAVKIADRELAHIQSFMLDSLAPVSAMLENSEKMYAEDIREASSAATELIGNANAKMSAPLKKALGRTLFINNTIRPKHIYPTPQNNMISCA